VKKFRKVRALDGTWVITCEEVLTFLLEYVSGELAEERVAEFERHLERCSSCTAYLDSYRKTVELTRGASALEGDLDEMPADLIAAVLAARSNES